MSEQSVANNTFQQYNITDQDIAIKNSKIDKNYASIYNDLLFDEGSKPSQKGPINIGNKDINALSDIEGYNIDFLVFLKTLGLVEYQEHEPADLNRWTKCFSLKKNEGEREFPVWYKFNEQACRKFNDVIVLCGDYVRNSRNVSTGTVKILTELRSLLNFDEKGVGCGTEDKKKLFLLAGNHDIADYAPEIMSGDTQHDLKEKVLNLGLYPQLLLVNGDGKKLLFQHTNFPYREKNNCIVNKRIDPNKAIKLLNNPEALNKPLLHLDGFFNLRYLAPEGALQPQYQDINGEKQLKREVYSDHGIGYDAKFVGHDGNFKGIGDRAGQGGNVYNVNICNQNKQNFEKWPCKKKSFEQFINVAKLLYTYYKKTIVLKGKNIDEKKKNNVCINLAVMNALKLMNNGIKR